MKKYLVAIFLLAFAATKASAQTEAGTLLLGGSATFQANDGNNTFILNPMLGTFLFRNIAIGGSFQLVTSTEGSSSWAAGPFVRPYFGNSTEGKPFFQGELLFGGGEGRDTKFGYGVGFGYSFFLNNSVALELSSKYTKVGDTKGTFAMGVGFQIHLKK